MIVTGKICPLGKKGPDKRTITDVLAHSLLLYCLRYDEETAQTKTLELDWTALKEVRNIHHQDGTLRLTNE